MIFARVLAFVASVALLAGPVAAAALQPRAFEATKTALPTWCDGKPKNYGTIINVLLDPDTCIQSRLAEKSELMCGWNQTWDAAMCNEEGIGKTLSFFDIFQKRGGLKMDSEAKYVQTCRLTGMPTVEYPYPVLQVVNNTQYPVNTFNVLGIEARCVRAHDAPKL